MKFYCGEDYILEAVVLFTNYALLAIFAQNAVFTRGLGVSRLVQLVGDSQVSSKLFVVDRTSVV